MNTDICSEAEEQTIVKGNNDIVTLCFVQSLNQKLKDDVESDLLISRIYFTARKKNCAIGILQMFRLLSYFCHSTWTFFVILMLLCLYFDFFGCMCIFLNAIALAPVSILLKCAIKLDSKLRNINSWFTSLYWYCTSYRLRPVIG